MQTPKTNMNLQINRKFMLGQPQSTSNIKSKAKEPLNEMNINDSSTVMQPVVNKKRMITSATAQSFTNLRLVDNFTTEDINFVNGSQRTGGMKKETPNVHSGFAINSNKSMPSRNLPLRGTKYIG